MVRVLVVEDKAENLDLMTYLLKAFGHDPLIARDGRQGLEVAAAERPDLVVMDLHMPEMDGYEAAGLLKGDPELASIPLIAVTAYAMVGIGIGSSPPASTAISPSPSIRRPSSARSCGTSAPVPSKVRVERRFRSPEVARILVVDDREANRDLVGYLLRYFGHDVVTASDGAGALQAALLHHPDLVVMDLALPGIDGYTAARMIRAEAALRDTPLVAVSATNATVQLAHAAGFDAFYPLPIDPGEFMSQLEPFLGAGNIAGGG